jgi:hypothetical protein
MVVIALCAALVAAGIVLVVRWGAQPGRDDGAPGLAGWLRYAGAALAAGAVAGVLAAGPGGRLAMRLLALTSPDAEGAFTEAGEVVGEISLDGTLGFIVFGGLPARVLSGALYALLRPLLPAGRAGGVVLGALLLILAGTRIEPLRAGNIDFAVLGPAWLAVLAFTVLALFHGMVVVAVGARLPRRPAGAATGRRHVLAGRIAVAVLVLLALPGFVTSVADILEYDRS